MNSVFESGSSLPAVYKLNVNIELMNMLVILIIFSLIVHCSWHKKNTLECLTEMFNRDCKKKTKKQKYSFADSTSVSWKCYLGSNLKK